MAAALTITAIKQAFYAVGLANTAVLAALGNGAASWIQRKDLRTPAPAAPFVALTFGPTPGAALDVRTLFPTLWLYDDDAYAHVRLNSLAALIEAAYPTDAIAYCYTSYAGGIGDEITDATLQRPALALRYLVKGRF